MWALPPPRGKERHGLYALWSGRRVSVLMLLELYGICGIGRFLAGKYTWVQPPSG